MAYPTQLTHGIQIDLYCEVQPMGKLLGEGLEAELSQNQLPRESSRQINCECVLSGNHPHGPL